MAFKIRLDTIGIPDAKSVRKCECLSARYLNNYCDHLEKLTSGDLMKSSFARLAAVVSIKVVDSSIMMLPSGPTCKKIHNFKFSKNMKTHGTEKAFSIKKVIRK